MIIMDKFLKLLQPVFIPSNCPNTFFDGSICPNSQDTLFIFWGNPIPCLTDVETKAGWNVNIELQKIVKTLFSEDYPERKWSGSTFETNYLFK
jgi:hypothetical protein